MKYQTRKTLLDKKSGPCEMEDKIIALIYIDIQQKLIRMHEEEIKQLLEHLKDRKMRQYCASWQVVLNNSHY